MLPLEKHCQNMNSLVIIDAWNGDILQSIPAPGNAYLQRPQWDEAGKAVTVVSLTDRGEGIMSYNTAEKNWNVLIEPDNNDIQSSFLRNDSLFFISSYSGTDNIWLLKPDQKIVPLTNSRFGTSDLNVKGHSLLFADYSSSGNNICHTALPKRNGINVNLHLHLSINRFNPVPEQSSALPDQIYRPVPYRRWRHLLRFHSWMPFYADLETIKSDPASVKPGLTLTTQNDLSTLISTVGYEYSDNRHKLHTGIKWYGWYFVIETRLDYGFKPVIQKFGPPESTAYPSGIRPGFELTNTVSLPLLFRRGYFSQNLYLSLSSDLQNNYIYLKEKGIYDNSQNKFTGRVYFSNYSRSAARDIYPKWAQILDLSHSYYPFDKDLYGNIFTARSAFYFPGIIKNQGVKLRLEAEKQNPVKFILGNRASFSRGYDHVLSNEINLFLLIILCPSYPDFNIGGLLYLPRIRADFFTILPTARAIMCSREAEMKGKPIMITGNIQSLGWSLFRFYLFRIPFMISSGVQAVENVSEPPELGCCSTLISLG
jgi:hypothetical protein